VPYKLGTLLSKMNKKDQALETFFDGIRRHPNVFYLHAGLFATYKSMGEDAKAREVLENWLRAHPDDTRVREFLARESAVQDTT
jgi:predicted Zn-dependent protease